ncbi:MAG TPA: L,D-transpeptidase family protein [Steroidobacteraceae bacterium]|nr:L,D-transpeptidase family protein [Steroidobacteraceae bacterium]
MSPIRKAVLAVAVIASIAIPLSASETARDIADYGLMRLRGQYTVQDRLTEYAADVESRLRGKLSGAGLSYPPAELAYVAFKDIRRLQVYGRNDSRESWRFVREYRVQGASGTLGPKIGDGDRQVPEGVYRVEALNPNSRFHLSLRLNYPNDFDRAAAELDGRSNLGGDIMIHGARASIGCLAMGNEAAEDLFVLAALAGPEHVRVVISPTDFRDPTSRVPNILSVRVRELYLSLRVELLQFPNAPPAGR